MSATLSRPLARPTPPPAPVPARFLRLAGLGLAAATALVVWSALRAQGTPPLLGRVPDIVLTAETGRPVRLAGLGGSVWVADFMFTSCSGQCMRLTGRMAELQRTLPGEVKLVSFSVDPSRDTPEALARYARANGAQPGRWTFLTGAPEAVKDLVLRGFKLPVEPGADPREPIVHSDRLVLVDRAGSIRGYYDAGVEDAVARLLRDASRL